MGWSISEREERISNRRFVVSRASPRLPPPIDPLVPAALARRVISGALGGVDVVRSGVRGAGGGEEGVAIMDSDTSTLMNDIAVFCAPC